MRRILLALATTACALLPATAGAADLPSCTTTRTTATSAQSAVTAAAPGDVVCLADGTYGRISLNARKPRPGVTLRAEHPGQASVAGVTLAGQNLTASQLKLTGDTTVQTGSKGMTVEHNLIVGARAGYGVFVCPATPPDHCDDVTIRGNRFDGAFDEDAIRANVYHDADGDGNGLLVEGNEFTGNVEYGGHNDVFQSVWTGDHLVLRRNYLHDFGGQGLFVKDQSQAIAGLVVEDNLIVRQNRACDPASLCPTWQLSPLQLYGPASGARISHNTVWPTQPGAAKGGGLTVIRNPSSQNSWTQSTYTDNVIDVGGRESSVQLTGSGNTHCAVNGGFAAMPGSTVQCAPAFLDPAAGDYRQANGRGVTWRVSDQTFGPTTTGPPPPPADRDGDGIPDTNDRCPDQAGTQPNGCPPQPPDPGCDTACEADYQAQIAGLRDQLAAATASRDAWKQRAERAEALIARIHQETSP